MTSVRSTGGTPVQPPDAERPRAAAGGYRWVILGVGVAAQASTAAYFQGLAALAPFLRRADSLSLSELGLLLGAPNAGFALTLLAWGRAADHFGERRVMAVGLTVASAALVVASVSGGVVMLGLCLLLAGGAGASVNAASGRSVMGWFSASQRGIAMGVRQTSVPLGAALAALVLPLTAQRFGLGTSLLVLAAACFFAAVAAALWVREAPEGRQTQPATETMAISVLRDSRAWRLAGAGSLLVVCQFTLVAFMVEVLHGNRGLSIGQASLVFAAAQLLGGAGRLAVGYWSDRVGHRVRPLRAVAVAAAVLAPVLGLAVEGPVELLVPVLVAEATLVICWNGLAFTAAAEQAPSGRAGTALGFQNTASYVSAGVTPVVAGLLIAAYGYGVAFALLAVPATLAVWLLGPLAGDDQRGGLASARGARRAMGR